ncbi:C2H2-type zinc finger protein [Halorientalis salina]|uniref:C2H2-type zinc finger protein n=1 Tax=Halorientalis salina TaxID=2932266 RepID=UPI0020229E91|nr:C2H2-type zinc finger protein [Halorientalis salina]
MSTHTDEPTTEPIAAGPNDDYSVPADDETVVCEYCGAPFSDEAFRALHWGLEHESELTDDQREAAQDAFEDENQALRLFQLKALGVLVVLYFGLMMAYLLVT